MEGTLTVHDIFAIVVLKDARRPDAPVARVDPGPDVGQGVHLGEGPLLAVVGGRHGDVAVVVARRREGPPHPVRVDEQRRVREADVHHGAVPGPAGSGLDEVEILALRERRFRHVE